MRIHIRRPSRLLGILLIASSLGGLGCSKEPVDPWAETQASRDAVGWHSDFEDDPKQALKQIQGVLKRPNLYDLHHPDGALAKVSGHNPFAVTLILTQVGFPIEVDPDTGKATVHGQSRHLWMRKDLTQVTLPSTFHRRGYPESHGLISLTEQGQIRVASGDYPASPISPQDTPSFLENWSANYGPTLENRPQPRMMDIEDEGLFIHIQPDGGLTLQLESISTLDNLQESVQAILSANSKPVFVVPHPYSEYGLMVQVFDRLVAVAENGYPIRYALPHGDLSKPEKPVGALRRLRPKPKDEPVLVLKVDEKAKFRDVQPILDHAAKYVDRVVLRTQLDLSDKSRIDGSTWPGGLFGGLTLALAHPAPVGDSGQKAGVGPQFDITDIWHVEGDVQAPAQKGGAQPEYTDIARKARIQGTVILQAVIDTEGRVQSTKVLKGLPMGLSEQAQAAVQEWTFQPAMKDGQPVKVYYNITVNFRL